MTKLSDNSISITVIIDGKKYAVGADIIPLIDAKLMFPFHKETDTEESYKKFLQKQITLCQQDMEELFKKTRKTIETYSKNEI